MCKQSARKPEKTRQETLDTEGSFRDGTSQAGKHLIDVSPLIVNSRGGIRTRTRDYPRGILSPDVPRFFCVGFIGHLGCKSLFRCRMRQSDVGFAWQADWLCVANIVSDFRRRLHAGRSGSQTTRAVVCPTDRGEQANGVHREAQSCDSESSPPKPARWQQERLFNRQQSEAIGHLRPLLTATAGVISRWPVAPCNSARVTVTRTNALPSA